MSREDLTERKNQIRNQILTIYKNAVDGVSNVLSGNIDVHFYETENGWDKTPDKIPGFVNVELSPEEILNWMYENNATARKIDEVLYVYTDDEIKSFNDNRIQYVIDSWKKSIGMHEKTIALYRRKIANAESKLREASNEG